MQTHRHRNRFLAVLTVAFFACFSTARAADETPPGTPPGTPTPAPKVEAPAKPAARKEETEPKTLTEALGSLKTARAERDDAETKLGAEELSHGKTKEMLTGTLEIAKKAKADLAERDKQLADITKKHGDAEAAHGKTKELLTLAEAAAGVKGVDPKKAIAVESPAAAAKTMKLADFNKLPHPERNAFIRDGGALED